MTEPSSTPIQAWPPRRLRGRPGFSARHFETVAGSQEDPLRVAERIVNRQASDHVAERARKRREGGEDLGENAQWSSRQIETEYQRNWERLCDSFDAVIESLESTAQTPPIKRLLREARRAARKR